jgi:hypothetical protein
MSLPAVLMLLALKCEVIFVCHIACIKTLNGAKECKSCQKLDCKGTLFHKILSTVFVC